jgi:hypothetical protein
VSLHNINTGPKETDNNNKLITVTKLKSFFPISNSHLVFKLWANQRVWSVWDEVAFSKIVLFNFHSKEANIWIGAFVFQIMELFIAILTWHSLEGSNRPFSLFFHPLYLWWRGEGVHDKFSRSVYIISLSLSHSDHIKWCLLDCSSTLLDVKLRQFVFK